MSQSQVMHTAQHARRCALILLGGEYQNTALNLPINPASWTSDKSAEYANHNIVGHSHPFKHFTHGSDRIIAWEAPLEAKSEIIYEKKVGVQYSVNPDNLLQPVSNSIFTNDGADKLMQCINFLESLVYPRRFTGDANEEGDVLFGPPPFLFVWGRNMAFQAVMHKVTVSHQEFQPMTNNTLRARVTIEMAEVVDRSVTHEDRLIRGDRPSGTQNRFAR